ncbi:MAG: hypothetical protein LBS45_10370 [Synergistaceae bacterium]|nr:hypothetical protein [Synergistaceae bacterium]
MGSVPVLLHADIVLTKPLNLKRSGEKEIPLVGLLPKERAALMITEVTEIMKITRSGWINERIKSH